MTTLYLVRHGETIDNVNKIMQGQRHGELTPAGIEQIRQLATSLSSIHFDAIIASDLHRAYDSARIVAEQRDMSVATTALLRERDWGDFTGQYILGLKGQPLPENVEKMDDLLNRARTFLDWTTSTYPDSVVLAVGHGIINKAIQAVHYGIQTREVLRMENAEYRILYLDRG